MNHMHLAWHADPVALRDYVENRAAPSVAWSVETHLPVCRQCRDVLARVLDPADVALLAVVREAMALPVRPEQQPKLKRQRAQTGWRLRSGVVQGVFGPWWSWVGLVLAGLLVLSFASRVPVPAHASSLGLTWLLALSPVVPVVMVAAVYGLADRDSAAGVTPRGGLELILVRTAVILAVAIPVVVSCLWATGSGPVAWLLPGLGLCVGALALGSWFGIERAAVGLSVGWALLVGLAMTPDSTMTRLFAPLIDPNRTGTTLWLALLVVATGVLLARLDGFDTPGRMR